jgi:glutathione S-transferase
VRAALIEKGVAHTLREMTPADAAGEAFLAISPFRKVPVLEHDGLLVRETPAILRYVDAVFAGAPLLPSTPAGRARVDALVLAAGNYLYPTAVMGVFFAEAYIAANGGVPDSGSVGAHVAAARPVLAALEREIGSPFAVGADFGLADCALAPMLDNLAMAPAGAALLAEFPRLSALFGTLRERPSIAATRAPIPRFGLPA